MSNDESRSPTFDGTKEESGKTVDVSGASGGKATEAEQSGQTDGDAQRPDEAAQIVP